MQPNSAAFRSRPQARAARMTPFEGTNPTFKQSPPIICFSINPTLAPDSRDDSRDQSRRPARLSRCCSDRRLGFTHETDGHSE